MAPEIRLVLALLLAYFIGSIPFAVIVVKIFWKQDICTLGSGNTGATNVLRVFGTAPGVAVLLLDGAKGALGVWIAMALAPAVWGPHTADWFGMAGAIAAMTGHSLSPFIGWRGGKAVATAAGAVVMLAPMTIPVLVGIFVLVVAIWRYVSLGSVVIATLFPGVCWLMYPHRPVLVPFAAIVGGFVIWRHRSNIGRIRRGEESKITFKRRMWDDLRSRHHDRSV